MNGCSLEHQQQKILAKSQNWRENEILNETKAKTVGWGCGEKRQTQGSNQTNTTMNINKV